ncbi:DNA polymerase III subunit delta' [Bifidobacterium animalis]|uniref:DNA polymerase III subunit delta' n=1 Tax=Bifidobacterium animalis TaxID=28025 RepID=UPI001CE111FF|nr:DNA polymerase III subunit delta' [Bifidobacterium animalis]UBZ01684.1 DNA polymerase III subunit delta' [Bifidobacterium animalis subsp. lactis]
MSVWDTIVGQPKVVEELRRVAEGDGRGVAQSWLICGPAGSGTMQVARAFAAALESPDHGEGELPTKITSQILADRFPDVVTLSTDKVTIGIDEVRDLVTLSEQMPSTAPWRIIIIENTERMLERTTNVLLKEIEEPSAHTIWLLCAPSAQDVLPTIRSRTRLVTLGVPVADEIATWLEREVRVLEDPTKRERARAKAVGGRAGAKAARSGKSAKAPKPAPAPEPRPVSHETAVRIARLCEGNLDIARLYARYPSVLRSRDQLVNNVLKMTRASQAVVFAGELYGSAQEQANERAEQAAGERQAEFRKLNGLSPDETVPADLRRAYTALAKKDDIKRHATRMTRDVLDRAFTTIASIYRDVAVFQNDAEGSVGLINIENRDAIAELSAQLTREQTLARMDAISTARRRIAGNGNALLDIEALFCALLPERR